MASKINVLLRTSDGHTYRIIYIVVSDLKILCRNERFKDGTKLLFLAGIVN